MANVSGALSAAVAGKPFDLKALDAALCRADGTELKKVVVLIFGRGTLLRKMKFTFQVIRAESRWQCVDGSEFRAFGGLRECCRTTAVPILRR